MGLDLNESQRWTLLNALTTAKHECYKDAKAAKERGETRLEDQFKRQHQNMTALYEMIEQAAAISIEV